MNTEEILIAVAVMVCGMVTARYHTNWKERREEKKKYIDKDGKIKWNRRMRK